MATNKLQWKRIAKGDKLPCQSFLRKKNGEILKLSTGAGVTVGQDAYYLPVDDVINVIKDYPVEESEDGKIRKALVEMVHDTVGDSLWVDYNVHKEDAIAWLEKQGVPKEINPSEFDSQLNRLLGQFKSLPKEELASSLSFYLNVVQNDGTYKSDKKQGEQKPAWSEEDEKLYNDLSDTYFYNDEDYPEETYKLMIKRFLDWMTKRAKSLRPQTTWKPSNEQMNALEHFVRSICESGYASPYDNNTKVLYSLLSDLKKLKG